MIQNLFLFQMIIDLKDAISKRSSGESGGDTNGACRSNLQVTWHNAITCTNRLDMYPIDPWSAWDRPRCVRQRATSRYNDMIMCLRTGLIQLPVTRNCETYRVQERGNHNRPIHTCKVTIIQVYFVDIASVCWSTPYGIMSCVCHPVLQGFVSTI